MRFLNLLLLTVVFSAVLNLSAFSQATIRTPYYLRSNMFGKSILSAGVTTGPAYGEGFGFQAMFDYRVAKRVSVGVQGNIYFLESKLDEFRQLSANARVNYHILKQHKLFPNKWDWYVGAFAGADFKGEGGEIDELEAFFGAHTGIRYKINRSLMAYLEAGTRNTSIGIALDLYPYYRTTSSYGKTVLSGGVTTGPAYEGGFGLQGVFDYRLAENFSMGLQGNAYFLESKLTEFRQASVNFRGNYHLLNPNKAYADIWDWYLGAFLGIDLLGEGTSVDRFEGFVGAHTGIRYKFSSMWAAYLEVGTRNSSVGLALTF